MTHLTPLGWTCIGNVGNSKLTNTVLIKMMLQRFWETETDGIENLQVFKADEKAALNVAEWSITYKGKYYRIAIPWKENFTNLPNSIDMAERRSQNLELSKQLLKNTWRRDTSPNCLNQKKITL